MNVILQHDERDCGAACLSMVASYYGLRYPLSKYRELTKTDKAGTNLYGLIEGASRIHLRAEALFGSPEELSAELEAGHIAFPFIAHMISENTMLHYVVVFGRKGDSFLIGDPAKGKLRLPADEFFSAWTGYLLAIQKAEGFQAGNHTKGSLGRFLALLRGQYGKLAAALLLSFLVAVIGILGAFVFQLVLDDFATETGGSETQAAHEHAHITESDEEPEPEQARGIVSLLERLLDKIGHTATITSFQLIFIGIIGLYLLSALIQFARGYLIISLSKRIDIRLTLMYYNHIVGLPVSSLAVRQTGEYLSRFSDADAIRSAVSGAALTLILDALMVIACGVILYLQNRVLFAVSFLVMVIYAVIAVSYRKPVERANRRVMENNARLQSYFKESIDGMETVKAACADEQVKSETTKKFGSYIQALVKKSVLSMSQDILAGTVELLGTVIILWIGFALVLANQISVGALLTFYVLLTYFLQPIKNLIELQPTIQSAFVAADRLNDILDLQEEALHPTDPALPSIRHWEMRNMSFRYGNRELTLQNVNLSFSKGEKIAIVGESGCGKTTLAKLFLRFDEPEKGCILLNGEDIRRYGIWALRKDIAYVGQNTFLFADTIRNNLTLGNLDVTDEDIQAACQACHADAFIQQLPFGMDTPLDENGVNLSGGQRQRLAIARALLRKPQMLILDEATSHLDTITENGVQHAVFASDPSLTCLIIAHRLRTVQGCDRIYVMENGSIVESGTHEALLARKGKYAALFRAAE